MTRIRPTSNNAAVEDEGIDELESIDELDEFDIDAEAETPSMQADA